MNIDSQGMTHFKLALESFIGIGRPHNQSTLAAASGVARTLISGFLNDKRAIGRKSQEKIANACGLSLADFFALGQALERGEAPESLTDKQALPLFGLLPNDQHGWGKSRALSVAAGLPTLGPMSIAVMIEDDSLVAAGLYSGMICYCDPEQKPAPGDLVYLERVDQVAALRIFLSRKGDRLHLRGWRRPEARTHFKTFDQELPISEIVRVSTVIFIRRRL